MAKIPGTEYSSQQKYQPSTQPAPDYSAQAQAAQERRGFRQQASDAVGKIAGQVLEVGQRLTMGIGQQKAEEAILEAEKYSNTLQRNLTTIEGGATAPAQGEFAVDDGSVNQEEYEQSAATESAPMRFQRARELYDRKMEEWWSEQNISSGLFSGAVRREFDRLKAQGLEQTTNQSAKLEMSYLEHKFQDNFNEIAQTGDMDRLSDFVTRLQESGTAPVEPWKLDDMVAEAAHKTSVGALQNQVQDLLANNKFDAAMELTRVPSEDQMSLAQAFAAEGDAEGAERALAAGDEQIEGARERLAEGNVEDARAALGESRGGPLAAYVNPHNNEVGVLSRDTLLSLRDNVRKARDDYRGRLSDETEGAYMESIEQSRIRGDFDHGTIVDNISSDDRLTNEARYKLINLANEYQQSAESGEPAPRDIITDEQRARFLRMYWNEDLGDEAFGEFRSEWMRQFSADARTKVEEWANGLPERPSVTGSSGRYMEELNNQFQNRIDEAENDGKTERATRLRRRRLRALEQFGTRMSTLHDQDVPPRDAAADLYKSLADRYLHEDASKALKQIRGAGEYSGQAPDYSSPNVWEDLVESIADGGEASVSEQALRRRSGSTLVQMLRAMDRGSLSSYSREDMATILNDVGEGMLAAWGRNFDVEDLEGYKAHIVEGNRVAISVPGQEGDSPYKVLGSRNLFTLSVADDGTTRWKIWDREQEDFVDIPDTDELPAHSGLPEELERFRSSAERQEPPAEEQIEQGAQQSEEALQSADQLSPNSGLGGGSEERSRGDQDQQPGGGEDTPDDDDIPDNVGTGGGM